MFTTNDSARSIMPRAMPFEKLPLFVYSMIAVVMTFVFHAIAPPTIDTYYTALVAHDMASPDWGKPKSGIPDYSCSPDESL